MATVELVTKTIADIQDVNRLMADIMAAVPKVVGGVKIGSDTLQLQASSTLGAAEDTLVDSTISGFVDSDPQDKEPKILDYRKPGLRKHFTALNYKGGIDLTQALIPKRTVVKGEVQKVEWFLSLDVNLQPTNKIIEVDIAYTRDASGFAQSRTTTRKWVNRDGTFNEDTRTTTKYYFINTSDMIDEGLRRRSLITKEIKIPTLTFMTEVLVPLGYTAESVYLKGLAFLDDYESEFNKFIDNSSTITNPADPDFGEKSVVVRIRDEANADYVEWLDKAPASLGGSVTIRQYLQDQFDI